MEHRKRERCFSSAIPSGFIPSRQAERKTMASKNKVVFTASAVMCMLAASAKACKGQGRGVPGGQFDQDSNSNAWHLQ